MKHGFFSLKQFLSHSTKFPRGFWSSGIFPFTGIYLAGFFHSPRFFLSSRGFFHSLWFESLIFIQNSKIFKEMVRRFFTFSEKNYQIFMLISIQRDFSIHLDFFNPHLNPCFSWRNVIPPSVWREEWHICEKGDVLNRKSPV